VRLLFIGDIVGKPGCRVLSRALPELRRRESLDLVIANAENAADGSGITANLHRKLIRAGVDCVTLGDHVYRRAEIIPVMEAEANIVRPANYPEAAPGKRWTVVTAGNGVPVAVFVVLGRVYMRPVDCPFTASDRVLEELPPEAIVRVVDVHAEATSDKQLLGRYLDGRVAAVLGTHTHVATADEQILPNGTAFQCDVGMTGPCASILGRKIDRVTETTITFRPTMFQVATGDVRLHGTIVDIDEGTGKALAIRRFVFLETELDPPGNNTAGNDAAKGPEETTESRPDE
jgi:metallophosphoesterase (TIGR00282 family)